MDEQEDGWTDRKKKHGHGLTINQLVDGRAAEQTGR